MVVTLTATRLSALVAVLLFGAPLGAEAQPGAKVYRIAYLAAGSPSPGGTALSDAFRQGLRELGYVEGQNVVIHYRWAETKLERLPALAAELVQLKVDVIVAVATEAIRAAQQATRTIPIVMAFSADPVAAGLVASLAHPGGNVTGLSVQLAELSGKRLELLTEAVPGVNRVAVLWNPAYRANSATVRATQAAAGVLGVQLQIVELRSAEGFDSAFAAMVQWRAKALFVVDDPLLSTLRRPLADLAIKNGLPGISALRESAEAGLLIAYGSDLRELVRRSARYVDKILKGAKPDDLPVEQPTKFELVINLKAAKALGLTIPPSLLLRADQIIE